MNIDNFIQRGILVKQVTSPKEISDLFAIVQRDIQDAKVEHVSLD